MSSNLKPVIFRIVSFSLAGGDILQTIPQTLALYHKQWVNRSLSIACVAYATARYMTLISLITNGIGFFSTDFTLQTCKPFYMVPNITAMIAGMAVQILVFLRTYAISGRSPLILYGLGGLLLLGFPVQMFGIVYHRVPEVTGGECKGKVFNETDWNIVYYSAHMVYDVIACAVGTYYLIASSRISGSFNMSAFIRRVLRNGLLYTIAVFVANLWVVLELSAVLRTGVGATLPLAVVLIAAQHLILSTQRGTRDMTSSHEYSGPSTRRGAALNARARRMPGERTLGEVEMQATKIYVVSETYDDREPAPADRKRGLHETDSSASDRSERAGIKMMAQ
ncbi:unnamed protein product [Mycena citricolor]|uniref:Transmembrane protein n=1 Tax=Mycena citricolor TaxID=2018698 RepID=A0AAD2HHE9_9AGAR|nr:unnamed protein product [Mycena citricolor]